MRELRGKVAVVTGGASGIGSGICRALARKGSQVVVADLDGRKAEALAGELRGQGARAIGLPVDVSDLASVHKLAEQVEERGALRKVMVRIGGLAGGRVQLAAQPQELTPCRRSNLRIEHVGG